MHDCVSRLPDHLATSAVPSPSRPDRGPSSRAAVDALTAAILLAVVLALRGIGFLPIVINPDESIFMLAAREVIGGHLPYVTLFDNKPVGSTLILAAAFRLFGEQVIVVRLVGAACLWIASLGVVSLARASGLVRRDALLCGIVYIAFTLSMSGLATMTEILFAPFIVWSVRLLVAQVDHVDRRNAVLLAGAAGLACGAAVLIKTVPIVPGVAAATAAAGMTLMRGGRVSRIAVLYATFLAALAVPVLAAVVFYWQAGQFATFVYANWGFASAYVSVHPSAAMTVRRLATVIDALWPVVLLGGLGIFATVRAARAGRIQPAVAIVVAWLVGEIAAAAASLQFYPHYFLAIVAPLAILAGQAVRPIGIWLGAVDRDRLTLLLLGGAALIGAERGMADAARDITGGRDPSLTVAAAIRRVGGEAPSLFVTSYRLSSLYALTGAPLPPTRYAIPSHLLSRQAALARGQDRTELARVLASRPRFIVTDAADPPMQSAKRALAAALVMYRPVWRQTGITLFQLKDDRR